MSEEWRPVAGFEGYYSVSNLGNVRRDAPGPKTWPGRLLNQIPTQHGYFSVGLSRPGVKQRPLMVHRLVCTAFFGPAPTPKHEPNHKNGIKTDNRVENLEWATRQQNMQHAYDTGLHGFYKGSQASAAKLNEEQVAEILQLIAARAYHKDIAKRFGISMKMVSEIALRNHWTHVAIHENFGGRRKGRQVLTESQVREIKLLLQTTKRKHGDIGKQFGVAASTVFHIAHGLTWKHVS
jgi:transposase